MQSVIGAEGGAMAYGEEIQVHVSAGAESVSFKKPLEVWVNGFGPEEWLFGFRFGRPEAFVGWPLWGVYGAWVSFVILLYPLCYAYDQFKQKRRGKGITAWI